MRVPRIGVYSPTAQRCGIADYVRCLNAELSESADIAVIDSGIARKNGDYGAAADNLNQYDVAHIHYEHGFYNWRDDLHGNLEIFLSQLTTPRIFTFHCLPALPDHPWNATFADKGCHALVHSREGYDVLLEYLGKENVHFHWHPAIVHANTDHGRAVDRQLLKKTLIGIYGFVKPHKNYEIVIDALAELPEDVVLMILGGPQDHIDRAYVESLHGYIGQRGLQDRVRFTGYLAAADVRFWIANLKIVIAPFRSMTASGSIATVMGSGQVLLASNLGPNQHLAQEYGCLETFQQGNLSDLVFKIRSLLKDEVHRAKLQRSATEFSRCHSYRALAESTKSLYHGLLDHAHAGHH